MKDDCGLVHERLPYSKVESEYSDAWADKLDRTIQNRLTGPPVK